MEDIHIISWLLRRLPCGQQVGLDHMISKIKHGDSWSLRKTNFYDKDARRKICYSDKQTIKLSSPFLPLM